MSWERDRDPRANGTAHYFVKPSTAKHTAQDGCVVCDRPADDRSIHLPPASAPPTPRPVTA
jgi:hypothetical protein